MAKFINEILSHIDVAPWLDQSTNYSCYKHQSFITFLSLISVNIVTASFVML